MRRRSEQSKTGPPTVDAYNMESSHHRKTHEGAARGNNEDEESSISLEDHSMSA